MYAVFKVAQARHGVELHHMAYCKWEKRYPSYREAERAIQAHGQDKQPYVIMDVEEFTTIRVKEHTYRTSEYTNFCEYV